MDAVSTLIGLLNDILLSPPFLKVLSEVAQHGAEAHNLIDHKKYTVVGYSNCDSTEPVYTALSDLFLGCLRTRVYRTRDVGNGRDKRPEPLLVFIADQIVTSLWSKDDVEQKRLNRWSRAAMS